ncbi:hypothetical protein LKV13_01190 [Borrelia sp. BU AG58]|uniref:hypothetical protein n=1 Tax=Borrelia sp. BU AG58 TaxID=2887345 RepID=UPI001E51DC6A|nr:hypothetical protein [Borrelia sp. BU AG58]UER67429.1 hypothetical protein LKV13_01190 [Borrelia sp. BU AG58]
MGIESMVANLNESPLLGGVVGGVAIRFTQKEGTLTQSTNEKGIEDVSSNGASCVALDREKVCGFGWRKFGICGIRPPSESLLRDGNFEYRVFFHHAICELVNYPKPHMDSLQVIGAESGSINTPSKTSKLVDRFADCGNAADLSESPQEEELLVLGGALLRKCKHSITVLNRTLLEAMDIKALRRKSANTASSEYETELGKFVVFGNEFNSSDMLNAHERAGITENMSESLKKALHSNENNPLGWNGSLANYTNNNIVNKSNKDYRKLILK